MLSEGARWASSSDVISVFPTLVWKIQLEAQLQQKIDTKVLGAVYYLRSHAGADSINFHDPRTQTGIIRPPVRRLTNENTDQVVVSVKDGTLLLFPAYLRHSVSTNTSGQERISISFNIMFSAFTENLTKPLWSAGA